MSLSPAPPSPEPQQGKKYIHKPTGVIFNWSGDEKPTNAQAREAARKIQQQGKEKVAADDFQNQSDVLNKLQNDPINMGWKGQVRNYIPSYDTFTRLGEGVKKAITGTGFDDDTVQKINPPSQDPQFYRERLQEQYNPPKNPRIAGLHEAIGGALGVAAPAAGEIESLPAAAKLVKGLAAGTMAQKLVSDVLTTPSIPPEIRDVISDLTGLGAGVFAGKGVKSSAPEVAPPVEEAPVPEEKPQVKFDPNQSISQTRTGAGDNEKLEVVSPKGARQVNLGKAPPRNSKELVADDEEEVSPVKQATPEEELIKEFKEKQKAQAKANLLKRALADKVKSQAPKEEPVEVKPPVEEPMEVKSPIKEELPLDEFKEQFASPEEKGEGEPVNEEVKAPEEIISKKTETPVKTEEPVKEVTPEVLPPTPPKKKPIDDDEFTKRFLAAQKVTPPVEDTPLQVENKAKLAKLKKKTASPDDLASKLQQSIEQVQNPKPKVKPADDPDFTARFMAAQKVTPPVDEPLATPQVEYKAAQKKITSPKITPPLEEGELPLDEEDVKAGEKFKKGQSQKKKKKSLDDLGDLEEMRKGTFNAKEPEPEPKVEVKPKLSSEDQHWENYNKAIDEGKFDEIPDHIKKFNETAKIKYPAKALQADLDDSGVPPAKIDEIIGKTYPDLEDYKEDTEEC